MKRTRKQKLRIKEEKRQKADDRRFAVIERIVEMLGVRDLLHPFVSLARARFIEGLSPRVEVLASDESADDPVVQNVCRQFEDVLERPLGVSLGGQVYNFAVADYYRGYFTVTDFISGFVKHIDRRPGILPQPVVAALVEAMERVRRFEREHTAMVFGTLAFRLVQIVEEHLRIDQEIVWWRSERNDAYPTRLAFRFIVGKKKAVGVWLDLPEGRRKAYPCELSRDFTGPSQLTWNPAELGIGSDNREIPVFIGKHAIDRLHERIPCAHYFNVLHKMLCDSIQIPRIRRRDGTDDYLVEVSLSVEMKLGYFTAKIRPECVYVSTFLFLTMQGTPEAQCLRRELGLTRRDVEAFKLDNYWTLTNSDLAEDRELRDALVKCNCGHLFNLHATGKRIAWLDRYQNSFRKAVGLPFEGLIDKPYIPIQSEHDEIQEWIDLSVAQWKESQGWIVK